MKNVLIIGNGSIGKRHTRNVVQIGHTAVVLTNYPGVNSDSVRYTDSLDGLEDVDFAIVATPTANHLSDVENLFKKTTCKKVLIEKPISHSIKDAVRIKELAKANNAKLYVAYNMRFLESFDLIKNTIEKEKQDIRLVNIVAGQYLPEWRPNADYRKSYSANRSLGGGVDLDLSHEIDYMNWLFGMPKETNPVVRKKLSNLEISSPDFFKGLYDYNSFMIDVTLDYFRKKERTLKILKENKVLIDADFINKKLIINDKEFNDASLFDFDLSYLSELMEFLGESETSKLTTIDEAISVLNLLMLEG